MEVHNQSIEVFKDRIHKDLDFSVAEASCEIDRRSDDGVSDFIVYGAKLTFVDMSKVDFYKAKVKENSPESVYCNVNGIGDDGAVVLLPAAKEEERVVTVTLPEEEIEKVKCELKKCGLITALINGE